MKINFTDGKEHKRLKNGLLKKLGGFYYEGAEVIYDPTERIGKLNYIANGTAFEKVILKEKVVDPYLKDYQTVSDFKAFMEGAVFKTENDERIVKTSTIANNFKVVKAYSKDSLSSRKTDINASIDELIEKRETENAWDFFLPTVYGAFLTLGSVYASIVAPQEFSPLIDGLCFTGLLLTTIGLINGGLKEYIFKDEYLKQLREIKSA